MILLHQLHSLLSFNARVLTLILSSHWSITGWVLPRWYAPFSFLTPSTSGPTPHAIPLSLAYDLFVINVSNIPLLRIHLAKLGISPVHSPARRYYAPVPSVRGSFTPTTPRRILKSRCQHRFGHRSIWLWLCCRCSRSKSRLYVSSHPA